MSYTFPVNGKYEERTPQMSVELGEPAGRSGERR